MYSLVKASESVWPLDVSVGSAIVFVEYNSIPFSLPAPVPHYIVVCTSAVYIVALNNFGHL
jgi:hypothetical protein